MKRCRIEEANVRERGRYDIGWQEEAEAASPLSRRTLITIIYNMYARTYACPGTTDFFLFIYFHTEVRKAIRSMNLLSTFVFLLVCTCMCVCVRVLTCVAFTTTFLICLLFRGFSFSSIHLVLLLFLSHNNTLSDFLFIRSFYPRFTSHSPFLSLSRFIPSSSPRSFRVTKIVRRHVRVRGIERYEEEGFEGLGGRRVAER